MQRLPTPNLAPARAASRCKADVRITKAIDTDTWLVAQVAG